MAVRACLCFCLLLAFLLLSSARNTPNFFSRKDEEGWSMVGRSLKVRLEDYGEATANRRHDPARKRVGGGRKG